MMTMANQKKSSVSTRSKLRTMFSSRRVMLSAAILFGVVQSAREDITESDTIPLTKEQVDILDGEVPLGSAFKNKWKDYKPGNDWTLREWKLKFNRKNPKDTMHLAYYKTQSKWGINALANLGIKGSMPFRKMPMISKTASGGGWELKTEKGDKKQFMKEKSHYGLQFTAGERTYYLSFESREERDAWAHSFDEAMSRLCPQLVQESAEQAEFAEHNVESPTEENLEYYLRLYEEAHGWTGEGEPRRDGNGKYPSVGQLLKTLRDKYPLLKIKVQFRKLRETMSKYKIDGEDYPLADAVW